MKRAFGLCLILGLLHNIAIAQSMRLSDILDSIAQSHPAAKMYDAEIQSMNAASKGARNWMAPEISSGFWMTPYNTNLWKKGDAGSIGMGQYMISAEQMFPDQKYNKANEKYLRALSSVEAEHKKSTLNDLFAQAKENYNEWIVAEKKLSVIDEGNRLLQLMITNAETRYKNCLCFVIVTHFSESIFIPVFCVGDHQLQQPVAFIDHRQFFFSNNPLIVIFLCLGKKVIQC